MIDIHTHILPFVDDGSKSTENSLKMLCDLSDNGVTDVIITPHYRGSFVASKSILLEEFEKIKELAKEIPLNLYLGQEIYCNRQAMNLLTEGELLTLNGTKYVLLEFHYHNPTDIVEAVYVAKTRGFIPIVAHVERYEYLDFKDLYEFYEIKNLGGLIQINASSLLKKSNPAYFKRVTKLLKLGLVDFIASDCHDFRPIRIGEVRKLVEKKYGKQTATKLFDTNALPIINGQTSV